MTFRKWWYLDAYKQKEKLSPRLTAGLVICGIFLLLSLFVTAVVTQKPEPKVELQPIKVRHQMMDEETMVKSTEDSVEIGPYWEF